MLLVQMDHRATQRHNLNFQPDAGISDEDDSVPTVTEDASLQQLKPSVRRGIRHVSEIWSSCEPEHNRNCWRKVGIVLVEWTAQEASAISTLEELYKELQPLINRVEPAWASWLIAAE